MMDVDSDGGDVLVQVGGRFEGAIHVVILHRSIAFPFRQVHVRSIKTIGGTS